MLLVLPTGEWDNACNELQRMMIVRSLRPDRVQFCVSSFIVNNLGSKFVEPPVLDMQQVVEDSSTHTPLIFVLSPGVVSCLSCHMQQFLRRSTAPNQDHRFWRGSISLSPDIHLNSLLSSQFLLFLFHVLCYTRQSLLQS